MFNDAKFVKSHPKRCCQQITKLLYLLSQGETFSGADASEVFFGVTKLFQSPDVSVWRRQSPRPRVLTLLGGRATCGAWCTCS